MWEPNRNELTGAEITSFISYWPASQRESWHYADFCLGEIFPGSAKHLDLCYSFRLLCEVEYGGRKGLHYATKNYMRNYDVAAGSTTRCIPYERALRNLIVIMFLHHVGSMENSGSMEGHRLLVHECLMVAAALGHYHRWEHQVEPEHQDKPDWQNLPDVDFRCKYSSTLQLLGSPYHPAFMHPKLLGRCYDNVYHQGRLISDLPACGKPTTVDQTIKIYNQAYAETIGWIENSLDLMTLSKRGPMPMYLRNPDMGLHPKKYREKLVQPPMPLGRLPPLRDYKFDKAVRLVDLAWSETVPGIVKDDIDNNPCYYHYLVQEGDNYDDDDEEEMEVEDWEPTYFLRGTRGDKCPPVTYAVYNQEETPESTPHSTHTDMDAAMEFDMLQVNLSEPEAADTKSGRATTMAVGVDPITVFSHSMPKAATALFENFAVPTQAAARKPTAQPAPNHRVEDDTVWEWFLQRKATTAAATVAAQHPPVEKDSQVTIRLEMMPHKIERGWQLERCQDQREKSVGRTEGESGHSKSQKRRSQSRGWEEVDPMWGHTKPEKKVKVGIDWSKTGI